MISFLDSRLRSWTAWRLALGIAVGSVGLASAEEKPSPAASLQKVEKLLASVEKLRPDKIRDGGELDSAATRLKEAERELQLAKRPQAGAKPATAESVAALQKRVAGAKDQLRLTSGAIWAGPLGFGAVELEPIWVYLDPNVPKRLDARVTAVRTELQAVSDPAKKPQAQALLRDLVQAARGGMSPHARVAERAKGAGFDAGESAQKSCARASKESLLWRKRTLEAVLRRSVALSSERLLGFGAEGEEGMSGTLEDAINADLSEVERLKGCGSKLAVDAPADAPALTRQVVMARLEGFEVRGEQRALGSSTLDFGPRKTANAALTKARTELTSRLGRGGAAYARYQAAVRTRAPTLAQDSKSLEAARAEYQAAVAAGGQLAKSRS